MLLPIFTIVLISCSSVSSLPIDCPVTSCADGVTLYYPFWGDVQFDSEPNFCGFPGFGFNCSKKGKPVLSLSENLYHIENISYPGECFTAVNVEFVENECPRPLTNFTRVEGTPLSPLPSNENITIFYNCSSYPLDLLHITCLEYNTTKRSYAFYGDSIPPNIDWYKNCQDNVVVPGPIFPFGNPVGAFTDSNYTSTLQLGFQLYWSAPTYCRSCESSVGRCMLNRTSSSYVGCDCEEGMIVDGVCNNRTATDIGYLPKRKGSNIGLTAIIGVVTGLGGLLLILLFVYKKSLSSLYKHIPHWRNMLRRPTNVEVFLENYECLSLQRYTYSDVKTMTSSFKDTLGQGGYGSVFKGKLSDGRLVAVKVLKESKGSGEEFINEVVTIGRTNHVNVVSLLGFCNDGSRRALVYEFMTNGSLERFIYKDIKSSTTTPILGREELYKIALGIARGLEYLHRGCNIRILHFDIKPHNILLDQDYNPKISDFGLAKICPARESIVSMLGARGTIGYIAPEVYSRNFGGVSYKSDVYSYGMMVLEMIGGRRNIDPTVENASEIYFPHWIYNRLEKNIAIGECEEILGEDATKKMVLVGLWCIQTHPTNRPSMSRVVEMLEGSTEDMEMPPNPFTGPPPTPFIDPPISSPST